MLLDKQTQPIYDQLVGCIGDVLVDHRGTSGSSDLLGCCQAVFWQSPSVRKQARPNVRTPTARASGIAELEIVVDSHEQYTYHFTANRSAPSPAH
jgi:hypothetical protein